MTRSIPMILRLFLLSVLFCADVSVSAQVQQLVRLRLEPLSIRGRSGSPIPLQIKVEYNSPQILEGDLVLEVYNSLVTPEDLIATIQYDGIVLQGNDYIFNTVLPPIAHSHNQLYQIVCWFDTKDGRLSLSRDVEDPDEPHELLSIGSFERGTLIASVSGDRDYLKPRGNRAFLNNALSLDNFNANRNQSGSQQQVRQGTGTRRVQNYTCSWDAYSLPEDPLHLCAFDVVLLADEALSRLEDAQMKALTTWVRAGGSLCVLPDDTRLTGPHTQFLQTLFERPDDPDLRLSTADDGTLLVISSQHNPIVNRHFGLGRVTLLPNVEDMSQTLDRENLGRVVGNLWKLHSTSGIFQGEDWHPSDLTQLLKRRGLKIIKRDDGLYVENSRAQSYQPTMDGPYASTDDIAIRHGLQYELQPKSNPLGAVCETALMPLGVEMVPASVIAMLLVAYVVTIGPVDYFVLGYFKARKYTWVVFPIVTAAFTALTVNIAHRYMASSETGGRMSIVDVIDSGQPVRQTDLQMHFHGSQTTVTREAANSFTVPAQMTYTGDDFGMQQAPRSINRTIRYSGRFPQSYTTEQDMRQWEPQINRTMTLAPDAKNVPKIPWDDASLVTTDAGRRLLADQLDKLKTSDRSVDAIVLHGKENFSLFASHGFLFSTSNISQGRGWMNMDIWSRRYQTPPQDAIAAVGILEAASRSNTRDFFSIVSQVSPQGSASMEDLPILDQTDPHQWLLIVAMKERLHTTIYRRLFHVTPKIIQAESPNSTSPEKENE